MIDRHSTAMTARRAYLELSGNSLAASANMDSPELPTNSREFSPTLPDYPSQHSGFRSNINSDYSEQTSSSRRSYSPPAWRKAGSGWFNHHHDQSSLSPSRARGYRSKEPSPQYHDAIEDDDGDVTLHQAAARIPLPLSPTKGRSPSNSPEPNFGTGAGEVDRGGGGVNVNASDDTDSPTLETPTQSNYFRFSTRLDVVQKTQPIEETVATLRKAYAHIRQSKWHAFAYSIVALVAWSLAVNLFTTPTFGPVPDLIKVAGLAKSFEPAIYYSERGHAQISELDETGVAVWDLGESVRNTNMTSAPIIVHQLDELSDSIKTLASELTRFFAGVDGDIDNILLTMEWAQRELTNLAASPTSTISSVWSNTHALLTRAGLMSSSRLAQNLLGLTRHQHNRATLERVFTEYLSVLEEAISSELQYSTQLFQLFEAIDKQFLNLQRSVIREQDTQERLESDFLGSLWVKVIGVNASKLRKYEKNRDLLASVRDRTVLNKRVLVDHNQRLRQLQSNLETLRRKLVSPLVRGMNSSTLSVEEQVKGLEGTYVQLKTSRETQRRKMLELVFGAGDRRHGVGAGGMRGIGESSMG
ncbi:hypothetical protein KC327_g1202 [Hortaea werneckii]|nr:hypothetical protein KC366_g5956 [Hortaea werneckii]KAI7079361.1 hypothetical protein KC327_g1202 [Hortaea werneckii]KAI7135563.1 hypothetical protein KC337_g2925 [Hortaea werneckii]